MSIYSKEENIQILISLLKEHNIRKVIVSPGTSNISFVASVQSDDYFEVYSCVDERSAAYMACGLSEESGEPVVISCTGATASRNYLPGLTEAYYSKLPVIAVTATQHIGRVGQNVPQVLDRSVQMKDVFKKTIQLTIVHTEEDRWANNVKVNDALLECRRNGGGPVHINMETTYDNTFMNGNVPKQRKIDRYTLDDDFPDLEKYKDIAIFVGNHLPFDEELMHVVETFCEKHNAIVLCDHTSNYNGKYKILGSLISAAGEKQFKSFDLVINIGNISGSYMKFNTKEIWRVDSDGEIKDTYKKLTKVFAMSEKQFFKEFDKQVNTSNTNTIYEKINHEDDRLRQKLHQLELPFSNPFIVKNIIDKIEDNSVVHLAILNSLRSWNYFETEKNIKFYSNTGGFGIDGITSTAIGTALATDNPVYCFIGDLAFFYDMNSLGNINVKNNLRIMLINNGCGAEFHLFNNRMTDISQQHDLSVEYVAADGHFGNKSDKLVKHLAEDLDFEYISASTKEEFLNNLDEFTKDTTDKPIIFEVFTNASDESDAQEKIAKIDITSKTIVKNMAKKALGKNGVKIAKKIVRK